MERLLEMALQQASSAEVFEASSESAVVHFEANKLKQLENRQSTTVALRIVREGRIGFAAASGEYDPEKLVEISTGLGDPMKGIDAGTLQEGEILQTRGW